MKLKLFTFLLLATSFSIHAAPVTISQWTFETPNTPPNVSNTATQTGIASVTGNGSGAGVHASTGTDWTTPAGNGSAESWSANNWAKDDYWQFEVNTIGFENITLGWDQRSSGTGPRDFGLYYSNDGITFTSFGADLILADSYANFSRDLSSITGLNLDSSIFFRLIATSGIAVSGSLIGTSGTSAIDNFTVSGTIPPSSVPETLSFAFTACFLFAFLAFAHHKAPARQLSRIKTGNR